MIKSLRILEISMEKRPLSLYVCEYLISYDDNVPPISDLQEREESMCTRISENSERKH